MNYIQLTAPVTMLIDSQDSSDSSAHSEVAKHHSILELIAAKAPLATVLHEIARYVEQQSRDMFCSIIGVSRETGNVYHGAAPSLKQEFLQALEPLSLAEPNFCNAAVFSQQMVIVEDIGNNPLWVNHGDLAANYGLQACWSVPLRAASGELLGAIALYYSHPRTPSVQDVELVKYIAPLVCIAIERQRVDDALRQSEVRYREMMENQSVEEELRRQTRRSQLFAEITLKIRQSLQLDEILNTTVTEVQRLLSADRVLLYKIRPNGSNYVVTEAVTPGWQPMVGMEFDHERCHVRFHSLYLQGRVRTIEDVETSDLEPCLVDLMRRFQIQAKLVVPIMQRDKLWGLLIAHQCDRPRRWSQFETELLQQLANQVGIALAQSQLVESLQRAEEELLTALQKEKELSELKSRFVSMISHEFRTPLTTIQSAAELLEYYDWSVDQKRERFQQIHMAVQHMTQLLEDVLLIGKVEAGKLQFRPELLNLTEFCQNLIIDQQVAFGADYQFFFKHQGIDQEVNLDPKLLRQILNNLLSNAIKYSPNGRKIQLSLSYYPHEVKLDVQDEGIGIPLEDQERLFEAFYRATNADTIQGTGLGLAIVKKCVDLHGGQITVKSEVGRGTIFTVTLPIKT